MKVANRKCIFRISLKNMKSTKVRNLIAVIAIALTTLLFTALFTIVMSISRGMEQTNFRMIGTCSHGEFKRLTKEQFELLKEDDGIKEYGLRRVVGTGTDQRLLKNYTEISYMDENSASWGFNMPTTGQLPKEGTREAAADTRLLQALDVPLEIGTEFSVTMEVDSTETTESFVLCGWWEHDEVSPASNVLIPHSRVEEIFTKLNTQFVDESIGGYSLTVMLKDAKDISGEMERILAKYGYSSERGTDHYIGIGVNWGYMSEGFSDGLDIETVISVALILLLIMLTGYLIIYNIFRISVSNEIRHYGMLKTIGTTGTQIRRIILIQAMILSGAGIPLGLVLGWGTGAMLTPIVIGQINVVQGTGISISPMIFVFAIVFSVITVLISCFRPGKIAASASPIEALRYTEAATNRQFRKGKKRTSIVGMAAANLAGAKGKTILTVLSLSLSVVLFTLTITFTNSFSIEKYLSGITSDFLISSGEYFNVNADWDLENAPYEEEFEFFAALDGVIGSGVTYGMMMEHSPRAYFEIEVVRDRLMRFGYEEDHAEEYIERSKLEKYEGMAADIIQILGMDAYCLDKMILIEGDIARLQEDNTIAVTDNSVWNVGDTIIIEYLIKTEFVNNQTGQIYTDIEDVEESELYHISVNREIYEEEYEVVAKVESPGTMGYRYYAGENYIVSSRELRENVSQTAPLFFVLDVEEGTEERMEDFMAEYTENSRLDYESKATFAAEFESLRQMFVILGCALSFIVGLVGLLNFINIILTGIDARRIELATLQAIGMTGVQLRKMLIFEGLFYIAGAAFLTVALNLLTIPMSSALERIFAFCEYRFTILPTVVAVPILAMMGIVIPIISYESLTKKSVVERLRDTE